MIKQIGNHRVKHGNILDGIDDLMQGETCDIVYSDPPWGEGNLSYWNTMNKKNNPGAEKYEVDYGKYINCVVDTAFRYAQDLFWIEYGVKWREQIINLCVTKGFNHVGFCTPNYRSGSKLLPYDLHLFSKSSRVALPEGYWESIIPLVGNPVVVKAVEPFAVSGGTFLDACCGMGYSAQTAIGYGMDFRGNELNLMRLKKTISRLEKSTK